MSFNMLLCWCIGKAASQVEQFYVLPEHGKLYKYDCLAVNVIVKNKEGGINSCDIPHTHGLSRFNHDYMGGSKPRCQSVFSFIMCRWMVPMPGDFSLTCKTK